jgi:hypothetical protein
MHVKFRLCLGSKGEKVTRVYFVNKDSSLELLTQMPGWLGIDIETLGQDSVNAVAQAIANRVDDSEIIE